MEQVLQQLQALLGPQGTVTDPAEFDRYLIDERRLYHGRAALIALPASVAELAEVVGICTRAGIAVVPQGGNTGYCGGATPDESGRQVLINLSRLNRIRDLDELGFTMTVEAGAILADVQREAAARGMLFPLSMGSEGSCQLGGNLATNAGGLAVLRYGTAKELVLGLEVVLADGRIWHGLGALRKDNTGYDLKQLFLGAEGTLGIITAAVVKLFPLPTARETAWVAVKDLSAACTLLKVLRQSLGDCVASFEYVSRYSLELVLAQVPGVRPPLNGAYDHHVLFELTASGAAAGLREALLAAYATAVEQGLVLDGVIAETVEHRSVLWRIRESIPAAEKAVGGSIKHDVSVAISNIPQLEQNARKEVASRHPEAAISVYGHIGDGNLHFNVLAPTAATAEQFKAQCAAGISNLVHTAAAELQGSFSAEHGVGRLKRDLLARTKSEVALQLMRQLKTALDPHGLMNPGKVL